MINDDLVPISSIINQAKAMGVGLGIGDPRIHLAYLTKLRLLPQAIRRKIKGEVVGCYPLETVRKLKQIEELKNAGWTYGEIRRELERPVPSQYSGALAFLVIGLFLGYLAAVIRPQAPTTNQTAAPVVSKAGAPIYMIALPAGNLEKLGKMQINLAN